MRRRSEGLSPRHTSAYVSIRQHTSAYVSIHHTSAYVSIRACLLGSFSAYATDIRAPLYMPSVFVIFFASEASKLSLSLSLSLSLWPVSSAAKVELRYSVYVSIRHTSAYVSIRACLLGSGGPAVIFGKPVHKKPFEGACPTSAALQEKKMWSISALSVMSAPSTVA